MENDLVNVAYHEAAHAVARYRWGKENGAPCSFERVTIVPDGPALGRVVGKVFEHHKVLFGESDGDERSSASSSPRANDQSPAAALCESDVNLHRGAFV